MIKNIYIISYDIPDNDRRNKIAKTLKNYGYRVQFSVFECSLPDEHFLQMKTQILNIINPNEDNLRIYRLCEWCHKQIFAFGQTAVFQEKNFYII